MQNKKIIIVSLGREYGGAEKIIENIVKYLSKNFSITLFVNKDNKLLDKVSTENIKIVKLENNIRNFCNNIFFINKYVKENNIDIINTHGIISSILGALISKFNTSKFLVNIHSDLNFDFSGMKKFIYKIFNHIIIYSADKIITVSKNLESKIMKDKKVVTIYNGIEKNRCELKKIDSNVFNILFVGRLEKVKNVEFLINVIEELIKRGHEIKCTIVGIGSQKENLENLIKIKGINQNISFEGYKENVNEYINNANIVLLTSIMEGIPVTIIESFMTKTLVLASEVGGIPEIIKNKINGFTYKSNDLQMCCNTLEKVILGKIDINKIVESAYLDYCNIWSIENMINEYKKIYSSL